MDESSGESCQGFESVWWERYAPGAFFRGIGPQQVVVVDSETCIAGVLRQLKRPCVC
jgi:hypothetical protein